MADRAGRHTPNELIADPAWKPDGEPRAKLAQTGQLPDLGPADADHDEDVQTARSRAPNQH